jgi:hypothetical protein
VGVALPLTFDNDAFAVFRSVLLLPHALLDVRFHQASNFSGFPPVVSEGNAAKQRNKGKDDE